ncbi:hypothetical protein C2E23DRAFT_850763, partial [Lenzites betulinus]
PAESSRPHRRSAFSSSVTALSRNPSCTKSVRRSLTPSRASTTTHTHTAKAAASPMSGALPRRRLLPRPRHGPLLSKSPSSARRPARARPASLPTSRLPHLRASATVPPLRRDPCRTSLARIPLSMASSNPHPSTSPRAGTRSVLASLFPTTRPHAQHTTVSSRRNRDGANACRSVRKRNRRPSAPSRTQQLRSQGWTSSRWLAPSLAKIWSTTCLCTTCSPVSYSGLDSGCERMRGWMRGCLWDIG